MRKVPHLISSLVPVLFLALLGAGCSPQVRKARHLERADRYFAAGQFDAAEIEYVNTLQIDPQNPRALGRLGLIYFEQGRSGRALPFLRKACDLAPDNLDVRLKLGLLNLAAGKSKEARTAAAFVLDRQPQDDDALILFAEASIRPGEVAEARQRLLKLPAPLADRAATQVALGTLDLRQRNPQAAETEFKRAQTIDPKSSTPPAALGALYWTQGDLERADQNLKAAADLAPWRSPRRLQYARFKIQNGDAAAGRRILEEIVQKAPDYLPASTGLAEMAMAEKHYDQCAGLIAKMLARDPTNYDALLLGGRLHLAKGEPAKATVELERMAKIYPQSPAVDYALALAYLADNKTSKAMASLNQTVILDPNLADAKLLLAELRIRSGDVSAAIVSLKQLVERQPRNARAQLLLASAYRIQGDLDDAAATYRRLIELYPKNAQSPFLLGVVLLQQNKRREARELFDKALELAPDSLQPLEQLVNLDLAEKQYATALQRVEHQVEHNPTQAGLRALLARVLLAQGDTTRAEAALLKAIELQPDFRVAHLMLARLYVSTNQHQKALQNLQEIVTKKPQDIAALMLMGTIQTEEHDYSAARDVYEKLLAINPQFSPALNNLAYLYSEQLGQREKGYEMARKARELLPNDPFTADTLGWILYQKKQYPWALSLLQESADKLPAEPEIQFHLGMTQYRMGAEEPARVALQRALQAGPAFTGTDEVARCVAVLAIDPKTADASAQALLEKRLREQPDDLIAMARLAAIQERDGAIDKAIAVYQTALQAAPTNVRALLGLARLYAAQPQNRPKAFDLAKTAYKLAPDDPAASHLLGRLAYETGDGKWALSLLQETARKSPDNPGVLFDLAQASYSEGQVAAAESAMRGIPPGGATTAQTDEAKRFLEMLGFAGNPAAALTAEPRIEQVLQSDPGYVPALVVSATISEQKGNIDAAKQTYEKVLSRFPDFVPAKKRLAILYAADPTSSPRAYELATQARESFPDDPEVAKALGIIIYRQGNYTRSASLLKESASKRLADAQVMYYLGMAQYRLKAPAESKQALQRALELNLPTELAGEAKRVLVELK